MSTKIEDVEDEDVFNKNHGYDNERSDYNWKANDHVAYRYKIIDHIGKGSFGQVLRVYDYKKQTLCALKIIRN